MIAALKRVVACETLDREQARNAMMDMMTGEGIDTLTASFLTAYNLRQPTLEELQGFVDALMELCEPIDLDAADAVDIVGTGGDGKNTFNISTLSALIVAAAGVLVVKHGNYGSTSICGSSNVLEVLGYKFTNRRDLLAKQLEDASICFLHAPLFHPVMDRMKQVRRDLGMQTIFNLLGPLVNPASPGSLLLGVGRHSDIRRYQYLLQATERSYTIVHSMDGYDEISLTEKFKAVGRNGVRVFCPEDIGFSRVQPEDLNAGGTIEDAAKVFARILQGHGTKEQETVVIVNSAFAIQCARPEIRLSECIEMATDSLKSGKAYQTLKKLIELS